MEGPGKRRRRHDAEVKRRIVEECAQPGASVAAIALANGLNANLVHKWRRRAQRAPVARAAVPAAEGFVPVALAPSPEAIQIEVRRGGALVQIRWPAAAAAECAAWLRAWLV
jgi:transposase